MKRCWFFFLLVFVMAVLGACGSEGTGEGGGTGSGNALATFPVLVSEGAVVFISDRDHAAGEIYIVDENAVNLKRITDNEFTEADPSFSPDGTQILYTSNEAGNNDCWRMNLMTGARENLTADSVADEGWCRYSPDGAMLTFDSDRAGNRDIFMYLLQGRQGPTAGDPINISADNAGYDGETSCRPDPADNNIMRIVFTSVRGDHTTKEIYQMTFNDETFATTAPVLLTQEGQEDFPEADKTEADISPDVGTVAYKIEVSAIKHEIHEVEFNPLGGDTSALSYTDRGVRCALGGHPNYRPGSEELVFENVGSPSRIDESTAVGTSHVFLMTSYNDTDPFVFKFEPF